MTEFTSEVAGFKPCRNLDNYSINDVMLFDIETTGFSPVSSTLYLIGCMYFKEEKCYITQWLADDISEECELILNFFKLLKNYKVLVHYNGSGFDIPYIIKKCSLLNIHCDFTGIESVDIYKIISPLKCIFKIENLKQKSIEKFLDINREDKMSGGELIDVYSKYSQSHDSSLKSLLLIHNHDDVFGMSQILDIMNYSSLTDMNYSFISMSEADIQNKEIIFELSVNREFPKRVSYGNDFFYFTAFKNTIRVCVKIYTDELKFFYPNYKDYYYLPEEDRSIHKSVAFYVDKNFRTKAKAANCYSKKTGCFLPQYKEIISPYFKIDYYDKITYFEFTDDFKASPENIMRYMNHIFSTLLS